MSGPEPDPNARLTHRYVRTCLGIALSVERSFSWPFSIVVRSLAHRFAERMSFMYLYSSICAEIHRFVLTQNTHTHTDIFHSQAETRLAKWAHLYATLSMLLYYIAAISWETWGILFAGLIDVQSPHSIVADPRWHLRAATCSKFPIPMAAPTRKLSLLSLTCVSLNTRVSSTFLSIH